METSFVNVLILVALVLLLAVSGGISYLTFAEWRDRRRLDQESKEQRAKGKLKRK